MNLPELKESEHIEEFLHTPCCEEIWHRYELKDEFVIILEVDFRLLPTIHTTVVRSRQELLKDIERGYACATSKL